MIQGSGMSSSTPGDRSLTLEQPSQEPVDPPKTAPAGRLGKPGRMRAICRHERGLSEGHDIMPLPVSEGQFFFLGNLVFRGVVRPEW